jgi:hypothetical protein
MLRQLISPCLASATFDRAVVGAIPSAGDVIQEGARGTIPSHCKIRSSSDSKATLDAQEPSMSAIAPRASQDVQKRFAELNLHDSQLLNITIEQKESDRTAQVRLQLLLVTAVLQSGKYDQRPATLTFLDCTELSMNVDFWNKYPMGHAIDDGSCHFDADRAAPFAQFESPSDPSYRMDGLLVFTIVLCPESGEINALARDFNVSFG